VFCFIIEKPRSWLTTRTPSIRDHIKELNSARPNQPFFFLKPPTSLLLPGEGPVIRPRGVDLHYEIELALIMGKKVKDLAADDKAGAMDAIESESHSPDHSDLFQHGTSHFVLSRLTSPHLISSQDEPS
jgi:hypothetical protein